MFALKHKAGSSKIAQVEPIRGVQLSIPIELTQNGHRRLGLKLPYRCGMMAVAHVDSAPSDCGEPIADALNTLTLIRVLYRGPHDDTKPDEEKYECTAYEPFHHGSSN